MLVVCSSFSSPYSLLSQSLATQHYLRLPSSGDCLPFRIPSGEDSDPTLADSRSPFIFVSWETYIFGSCRRACHLGTHVPLLYSLYQRSQPSWLFLLCGSQIQERSSKFLGDPAETSQWLDVSFGHTPHEHTHSQHFVDTHRRYSHHSDSFPQRNLPQLLFFDFLRLDLFIV